MSSSTDSTSSNQAIQSTTSSIKGIYNIDAIVILDAINQLEENEAAPMDSLLVRLARLVQGHDKAVEINGNRYEMTQFANGKCYWNNEYNKYFSLFGRLCVFHALCVPRSDGYKFEIESLDKMHIKISVWNEGPRFPRCVPATFILKQVGKSKRKWDEMKQRSKDDLDCLVSRSKRKDSVDMLRETTEKLWNTNEDVDCLSPGNDGACPYCDPDAREMWFRMINRRFPGQNRVDKWKQ